jgi:outer membrane protein insertion porin family
MTQAGSRFLLVLLLLTSWRVCVAQASTVTKPISQMPPSARQLIAIQATGSKRFSEDAIAAATGLQLGTPVGEDDFKRAARRLGETGAFSDIAYSYTYSAAGTKLEFKVTDADKFVPVHFEDFVWFPDADLRRRINEHVPLFDGELPLSGRMPDEVSDVLQAMLVEKAIPGHVDYVREGKPDGPVEWISYKVSDVLIRVRNIEFTGAGAAEMAALESAARRMPDREYSRSRFDLLVQRDLLPVYHARGYLKATFGEPQPKAVAQPSTEDIQEGPRNQTVVDVILAVTPGLQYKLKSLDWSGNREFPTAILEQLVRVPLGQPANTVRLADQLKEVQTLYGSHGFITATVKSNAEFDDAAGTVAIHLEVKEGLAYHMGELEFRGLDNSLTAKLRNAWKLRQGDVYDASYLLEYLPAAQKLLPAGLDWEVSSHVTANGRDKTVDVDLIYSVKVPK